MTVNKSFLTFCFLLFASLSADAQILVPLPDPPPGGPWNLEYSVHSWGYDTAGVTDGGLPYTTFKDTSGTRLFYYDPWEGYYVQPGTNMRMYYYTTSDPDVYAFEMINGFGWPVTSGTVFIY